MKLGISAVALLVSGLLVGTAAVAATDHSNFIKGPFKTGPDVTKACLQCHQNQAQDFMKTVHWTWSRKQEVPGKGMVDLGKVNALNNYCISLPGNYPRCTSCHAGYGWSQKEFDFTKARMSTAWSVMIRRGPTRICRLGHPPTGEGVSHSGISGPVDLEKVAKSVGKTSRDNCGACHFYGGGGDHVKKGDLDSSMSKPKRALDVHMAVDGANMTCSACHRTQKHAIPGNALSVSATPGADTLDCSDCHAGTPHKGNKVLDRHAQKVACQTCHIPTYARELPTKVWWDWSTAGKDQPVPKDKYGEPLYDKQKGDFRWAKNEKPVYQWFNGSVSRYLIGDKIDPAQVTRLNYPRGERNDPKAKITPFKIMAGNSRRCRSNITPYRILWRYWPLIEQSGDADGMDCYSGRLAGPNPVLEGQPHGGAQEPGA
jgi:octaheme c-type cytochrome (tetrathionate reductase family)